MSVAPQRWARWYCKLPTQGHSPLRAVTPPTILFWPTAGRRPQAGERDDLCILVLQASSTLTSIILACLPHLEKLWVVSTYCWVRWTNPTVGLNYSIKCLYLTQPWIQLTQPFIECTLNILILVDSAVSDFEKVSVLKNDLLCQFGKL